MEIILAIIGIIIAIFSNHFFKDSTEHDDGDAGSPRRDQTASRSSSSGSETQTAGGANFEREPEPVDLPASIEEQQEEQRKQFADYVNPAGNSQTQEPAYHAPDQHNTRKTAEGLTSAQQVMRKEMRHNLTREGIVNGVIMSEVLGQPRALRPYRSQVAQRKQKYSKRTNSGQM
ncbi:hypothetical protein GCM10028778_09260 [Barrientosiimonas marina]|uniref:Uncharacterized protein n=1 Tax=Lentibacillus kimchii TaxID=1542911 RepID=A0ABW2UYA5_9BACI